MKHLLIATALAAGTTAAGAQTVTVRLSEWKVQLSGDTLRAGSVTFQVSNTGVMTHGLHIRGEGVDKGTRDIPARQAETLTVTLKPGTYELYCPMSEGSHKEAGMSRKIVVAGSG